MLFVVITICFGFLGTVETVMSVTFLSKNQKKSLQKLEKICSTNVPFD